MVRNRCRTDYVDFRRTPEKEGKRGKGIWGIVLPAGWVGRARSARAKRKKAGKKQTHRQGVLAEVRKNQSNKETYGNNERGHIKHFPNRESGENANEQADQKIRLPDVLHVHAAV